MRRARRIHPAQILPRTSHLGRPFLNVATGLSRAGGDPITDWRTRPTLSVAEVIDLGIIPVGRNQLYAAINRGEVPAVRIGARVLVPVAALRRLLGEMGEPEQGP